MVAEQFCIVLGAHIHRLNFFAFAQIDIFYVNV